MVLDSTHGLNYERLSGEKSFRHLNFFPVVSAYDCFLHYFCLYATLCERKYFN